MNWLTQERFIPDIIAEHARRKPDALAFIHLDESAGRSARLTYGELDIRSGEIARWLGRTIAPGERALLAFPSGLAFIETLVGCLKAGIVAVPVSLPLAGQSMQRLNKIADDAGACAILTESGAAPKISSWFSQTGARRVPVHVCDIRPGSTQDLAPHRLSGLAVAMVQYTSGTTGDPKGIALTHANIMANQRLIEREFGHGEETVFVSWLPHYHDMGLIGTILQPLYLGVSAILFSPTGFLREPVRWLRAISEFGATTSGAPNFAYEYCLERISTDELKGLDLSRWKVAFNGSEPVQAATLERFAARLAPYGFRPKSFHPCYGLAEATLLVSSCRVGVTPTLLDVDALSIEKGRISLAAAANDVSANEVRGARVRRLVGLGVPAPEAGLSIVDPATLMPCPSGRIGEIWLRSPSVGLGYWGQEARTNEIFRAKLVAPNGEGALRTGDLGFIDEASGELFITGRGKDLIILRGRNLYPQDIERAVSAADSRLSPTAAAFERPEGGLAVVVEVRRKAVTQLRKGAAAGDVTAAIRQRLWTELDVTADTIALALPGSLPKTTSGKIRRRSASELLSQDRLSLLHRAEAPLSALQERIASDPWGMMTAALARLTGIAPEEIPLDRSPIELGLDSLRAATLSQILRNEHGMACPPEKILAASSVRDLWASCRPAPESPTLKSSRGRFAATPLQRMFWTHHLIAPDSAASVIALAFCLPTALLQEHLERAARQMFDRHSVLRCAFTAASDGGAEGRLEEIASGIVQHWPVPPDGSETELRRRVQQRALQPFDLGKAPLFRIETFACRDGGSILLLAGHHIVLDLWSLQLILRDLIAFYDASLAGTDADLPMAEPIDAFLPAEAPATVFGIAEDLPRLAFPADFPPQAETPRRSDRLRFSVPPVLAARLEAFSRANGLTLHMLLLAAYALFLHRHSGTPTLHIGSPRSGRADARAAHTVGCFVEIVRHRIEIAPYDTPRTVLAEVKRQVLDCVGATAPIAADGKSHTLFTLQEPHILEEAAPLLFGQAARIGGWIVEPLPLDRGESEFDLSLAMAHGAGKLGGVWEYRCATFERSTIERLAERFLTLLDSMVSKPDSDVDALPLLPDRERNWLLQRGTGAPAPVLGSDIGSVVARQTALTPERVAVVAGERRISYRDLLATADRVAAGLLENGCVRESRIGMLIPPSVDAIIATLGIWRAGACYLPIDPTLPRHRIDFLLRESRAALAISVAGSAAGFDDFPCQVREMDALAATEARPLPAIAPGQLAWAIYTSGSTGTPKGVLVSHASALNFAAAQFQRLGLENGARVLQLAPFAFDASLSDMLMSLPFGGTLCIATGDARLPGPALETLIEQQAITLITASASLLSALTPRRYEALKAIISTAEPCHTDFVAAWTPYARLFNGYGPTETTIGASLAELSGGDADKPGWRPPIGHPFDNYRLYVLDHRLELVPAGVVGEIYVGGAGNARGYLDHPALTAERFLPDPYSPVAGARMYRTGDLGRWLVDGTLDYQGRIDRQIKIRGIRIEPGEIEAVVEALVPGARCIVRDYEREDGQRRLVAYAVAKRRSDIDRDRLIAALRERLPAALVPSSVIGLDSWPLTATGKLHPSGLPPGQQGEAPTRAPTQPRTEIENRLQAIWRNLLKSEAIGIDDHFFDVGGTSLMLPMLLREVEPLSPRALSVTDLFTYSTIRGLAAHLSSPEPAVPSKAAPRTAKPETGEGAIAIIGMALRFPGASDPAEFWHNLTTGRETIRRFSTEDLLAAGVPPDLAAHPDFVAARGIVEDIELFDADFFGYTALEADILDPQYRLLLECAQLAFDDAGHGAAPAANALEVGVFVGTGNSHYHERIVSARADRVASLGALKVAMATAPSFAATLLGYKFDLTGPCVTVDTACSSSLVAVHQACRSLLDGECDIALAGGASIEIPVVGGHLYEAGNIGSPDGHCRPFDSAAGGTVRGMGCGIVVMRPLEAALRHRNNIRAIIRGSAINNDGSQRLGFTAPSVAGQRRAIEKALARAGVRPETIGYIEAHGTGTELGDPVEMTALAAAFAGCAPGSIAVGAVKGNLGHLDAASGVAGLIKTILALEHRLIPATLHYTTPNPNLKIDTTPFRIADRPTAWAATAPRRAGVSSFGIGGTNAHVILEEAEALPATADSGGQAFLLTLSAKSGSSLQSMKADLAQHLVRNPDLPIDGVARTLVTGRRSFPHRFAAVASDLDSLLAALDDPIQTCCTDGGNRGVVFIFPGQGTQHVGMAAALYRNQPAFRDVLRRCAEILRPSLDLDIRDLLYPEESEIRRAERLLAETRIAQPVLFAVEYALAKYLESWGIRPKAMIGHSLGELVAACLAGVFRLEDALALVAERGRLVQSCPEGAMLGVLAKPEDIAPDLPPDCVIAAVNGPEEITVSGSIDAIEALEDLVRSRKIPATRLRVNRAFHSPLVALAREGIRTAVSAIARQAPAIPFISNVTGDYAGEEVCSADYWMDQLSKPVLFARGCARLFESADDIFLELGPGAAFGALIRRLPDGRERTVFGSIGDTRRRGDDEFNLLNTIGRLWRSGVDIAPEASDIFGSHTRLMSLPGYRFDRRRHWIDALPHTQPAPAARETPSAPATPWEPSGIVGRVWTELIGTPPSPEDDFFEIGGDSLLAVRFCNRLQELMGRKLSPRVLFEHPSYSDLARHIRGLPVEGPVAPLGNASPGPHPLSLQQRGVWVQDLLEGKRGIHNLPYGLHIRGKLDIEALRRSLQGLVDQHPVLAARIVEKDGEPLLDYLPAHQVALPVADLPPERIAAAALTEGEAPFSLSDGPLFRSRLLRSAPDDHVLVVTAHHIAADGWSLALLLDELATRYGQEVRGETTERQTAPQYADYVTWQRSRSDRQSEQAAYWHKALAGLVPVALPADRRAASDSGNDAANIRFNVPAAVAAAARQLARASRTSLFSVLLAAFSVLLHRYCGQEELGVCTPLANRSRSEFERIVGLFVNFAGLRASVTPALAFGDLVLQLHQSLLNAQQNLDLPFEQAVATVSWDGAKDRQLFPVAFALHNRLRRDLSLAGTEATAIAALDQSSTKFDLTLWIDDDGVDINGMMEYRTALFEAVTVEGFVDSYANILAQATRTPDLPVGRLPLMDAAGSADRMAGWNATERRWPDCRPVHMRIAEWASRTPDASALVEDATGLEISYAGLDRSATCLAERLRLFGAGPEMAVGICLPRSADLVIALLAVLKSGAAFVALDPDHPPARIEEMSGQASLRIIITRSELAARLPGAIPYRVMLDQATGDDFDRAAEPIHVGPENAAYIMFTSGTTGRPKGAIITHAGLQNRLDWMIDAFHFKPTDRILQKTPFTFDVSLWELIGTLTAGATLVLARPGGEKDPAYITQALRRQRISIVHFVPSMLDVFLDSAVLPSHEVRLLVCSGEALPARLQEKTRAVFGAGTVLVNLYGPTEAAIDVSCWVCGEPTSLPTIPIGWPIANTELHVLDAFLEPVPRGVVGELFIGGVGVARGYAGQPGLTARLFVPDPHSGRAGTRLYRTGDLARRRADESIEFLGRVDNQIKLRGQRIELDEIASTLETTGLVQRSACALRGDTPESRRIVAYAVPHRSNAGPALNWLKLARHNPGLAAEAFTTPDGTQVLQMNSGETRFLWREIFEDGTYDGPGIAVEPGSIVLDVGANIGLFALWANRQAKDVTVIAFEPIPDVFAKLRLNLEIHAPGGKAFNIGLAERARTAILTYFPHNTILSGEFTDLEHDRAAVMAALPQGDASSPPSAAEAERLASFALEAAQVEVQMSTLSDQIRILGLERIDILKIDVEGNEAGVLAGIADSDWDRIGSIVIEVDERRGTRSPVEALLYRHGFASEARESRTAAGAGLCQLFAYRPGHEAKRGDRPLPPVALGPTRLRAALRETLARSLPSAMQPSEIVLVEELPVSANGKLALGVLPERDCFSETALAPAALCDPMADLVAGILQKHLGGARPAPEDDFFRLGGNSLMAARITPELERATGRKLDMKILFEHRTVAALAAAIQALPAAPAMERTASGDPAARYLPFPLTDIQHAYWVGRSAGIALGGIATHGYIEINVGQLDRDCFILALNRLIARHDMLRSVVDDISGMQRILEAVPHYQPAYRDLSGLTGDQAEETIAAIRGEMSHRIAGLVHWPSFEVRITGLGGGKSRIHLSMDALAVDGWSLRLLERELNELYADLVSPGAAEPPAEPDTGFSFRDYVIASAAEDGELAVARAYWMARIDDLPPAPALPYRVALAEVANPKFHRRRWCLDREGWSALKQGAAARRLTPASVLLCAYAEAIASWSNGRRFLLSVPTSYRRQLHPDVDRLVGNFTALLLLDADMRAAADFEAAAISLQHRMMTDFGQLRFSGIEVRRAFARLRGNPGEAVAPVVFTSMLDNQGSSGELPGLFTLANEVFGLTQTSQVCLDCAVSEQDGQLIVTLDSVEELFPERLLDDLFEALTARVAGLSRGEDWTGPIGAPLPPRQVEARRVPVPTSEESRLSLADLVRNAAAAWPDRIAIDAPDLELSYDDLYRRAGRLANRLAASGVGRNELVAILMERGPEQIIAACAVLLAGAAYMPVDARLPDQRRRQLIEIGNARLILTQSMLQDDANSLPGASVIVVDDDKDTGPPRIDPASLPRPEDLAYVIFTSGSTGRPKGVMIDHRGAVNTVLDINGRFGVTAEDAVFAISSFSFDLSVYDIFGLLAVGGRIVLPDPARATDPSHWVDRLTEGRVTIWNSVPSLADLLAEQIEIAPPPLALRLGLLSGDWIPLALPGRLRRRLPALDVISLGGATEASIWSIIHPVAEIDPQWRSIPYGRPLTRQIVAVLDQDGRPCPDWVRGEIHIGGIGVAKGYWGEPERTAEQFVRRPSSGEIFYRTGDLGRYLPGGEIEFLGRADSQIKLNGHRIEPGEIEHAIESHPAISRAVVLPERAGRDVKRLSAFVVPDPEGVALQDAPPAIVFEAADRKATGSRWREAVSAGMTVGQDADIPVGQEELRAYLDQLTARYRASLRHAFRRFGLFGRVGERYRFEDILSGSGIVPRYSRWLERALGELEKLGILRRHTGMIECVAPLPEEAESDAEQWLADVLTEREHSAGRYVRADMVEGYQKFFQYAHNAASAVVSGLVSARSGDRPFQVLEVGGGYGSLTQHLLPLLPPDTRYDFTDVSNFFLNRAREEFAAYPFLDFALLDLDREPQAQGFEGERFDLVVASSVLHACRDIGRSLARLRGLLAPGGVLLLIEETRFFPFFDLGMGLQQGFDIFEDVELRIGHPLLSRAAWCRQLADRGFVDPIVLNRPGTPSDFLGFDVIVARAPDRVLGLDAAALDSYLRLRLPRFAIPNQIFLIDDMPLTANGKVDRAALARQFPERGPAARNIEPPRTERERQLAELWRSVLKLDEVGIHDDFFSLGGDSLQASHLTVGIRRDLKIDLPIRAIFEATTLEEQAALLDMAAGMDDDIRSTESPAFTGEI